MPSQSSRRKNVSKGLSLEHVGRLLQDGAVFRSPSKGLLAAAEHLRKLGIIDAVTEEFVCCANVEDSDFSSTNRNCPGRIYVTNGAFDSGELQCPMCGRHVYPDTYEKRRYTELRADVSPDGVLAYVGTALADVDPGLRQLAPGVFRLDVGDETVTVCIVEYCGDDRYLTRDRATSNPTCFIAVNPRDFEGRFLEEPWVQRLRLADMVCGTVDLAEVIRETATQGPPALVRQVSIPVCGKGPLGVIAEPVEPSSPNRRFAVEVGSNVVRVEGVKVVAEQAGLRFVVFSILWDSFLDDLNNGLAADQFHTKPISQVIDELERRTGKNHPDETTVRRALNRLQKDIEVAIKRKVGLPIDRQDIIQTCRWTSQSDDNFGYRINPFTVVARPFQANLSQES